MSILNTVKDVKANYTKYDQWEQKQADDKAKKEYLVQNTEIPKDKVELTRDKAKAVLRATEILDKKSEDNAESMEMVTGVASSAIMMGLMTSIQALGITKPNLAKNKFFLIAQTIVPLLAGMGFIVVANNKQKEASRIGRFQAKQNELKDVKNFVPYTSEQIDAAKILAENLPDKKDKKGFAKSFQDMKEMSKDKKLYKEWLNERIKNPDDIEKLLKVDFTEAQLSQGKEDKELIVSIVKDINVRAEEYSENVENVFDTLSAVSFFGAVPLGFGINKLLSCFKSLPSGAKKAVAPAVSLAVILATAIMGTTEQKQASKVGRFKMRQDILKNTNTLMPFASEDYKKAENVKAPEQKKSFTAKMSDNFKFLSTYIKDKKEYIKYEKTEQKENNKIYEALKGTDVSESQMKEAKHLQKKVFFAFDEVDEMSQKYSEDTEAGTEIVKQGFSSGWTIASMLGLAAVPLLIMKGKFPIHKIVNTISHIGLDKSSSIRVLIDDASKIISKDKDLKKLVCKSLYNSEARATLLKNKALKPLIEKATEEYASNAVRFADKKSEEVLKELMDVHFKKGPVAKWLRNLVADGFKLFGSSKMKKLGQEVPREVDDKLKFNYKNYKTLINTGIAGSVPVLGAILGVPFALNAWLTGIQKKAGKIGIMQAMEKIDNPKLFVNNEVPIVKPSKNTEKKPQTGNLIDMYKQV